MASSLSAGGCAEDTGYADWVIACDQALCAGRDATVDWRVHEGGCGVGCAPTGRRLASGVIGDPDADDPGRLPPGSDCLVGTSRAFEAGIGFGRES